MATPDDRAAEIQDRRTRSYDWMKDNFYDEWESVFKSYKCERDPEKDPDGNDDPEQSSVGMPMTWSHIRRTTARATAQIPNLRFRAKDQDAVKLIGPTLMYQWDRARVQRIQKRHFTQAALFGISIRPWYWAVEDYMRSKRIDPMNPNLGPAELQQISETYGIPVKALVDPGFGPVLRSRLLAEKSRGGMLPVKYRYLAYEGPKCDFLFIGDCYFQPNFQSIQSSQWFIVERRRSLEWIQAVSKRYPEMATGFEELLRQYPNGTPRPITTRDTQGLRERMLTAIGKNDNELTSNEPSTKEWTILEQHTPGTQAKLAYVGEGSIFIGEIEYPYDLDGKIAFTELVLIDDLITGVGDSTARVIRGLQALHDRQANKRMDLVDNILRPLIGTSNRELIENPGLIKRYRGFRLVHMRGPGDLWQQGEQAALAAAAVALQDESAILRQYQMATGESNMSMAANVDPQQARTATGARIMAYNQDVLTKDLVDMYNESIKSDAEMMFQLNRSELSDAVNFDMGPYNRDYLNAAPDSFRDQWAKAEPMLFQIDGEITSEVGSTLADDDDANVTKATNLFQAAVAKPDLFNVQTARDEYLIAMGKGKELQRWAAPPPSPPPPDVRANLSIAVKWELLSEQERQEFLAAGLHRPPEGAPPGGPGPGAPGAPPEPPMVAASAYAAAKGNSPFQGGMPQ